MHGSEDALFRLILGSNPYVLITYLKFQLLKCLSNIFYEKANCLISVSITVGMPQGQDNFLLF